MLLQHSAEGTDSTTWRLADHFVSEGDGWLMATQPGSYGVVTDSSQVNCTFAVSVHHFSIASLSDPADCEHSSVAFSI